MLAIDIELLKKAAHIVYSDYITLLVVVYTNTEDVGSIDSEFPFFDFETEGSYNVYENTDEKREKYPYYAVISIRSLFSLN